MPDGPSPGSRPLVDEPARRRILEETDRSFCVEAAAGTGKTTLLVGRILRVLASGRVRASQLAAITFTELAAAQLKSRLREKLQESSSPEHRRALEELESAQISTIHSMALAILKERSVEAGLDPGFETLDPAQATELLDQLWRTWLEEQAGASGDGSGSRALCLALACGLGLPDLKRAALRLYEHRDVALQQSAAGDGGPAAVAEARRRLAGALDALGESLERLRHLVGSGCTDKGDRLASAVHGVAEFVARRPAPAIAPAGEAALDDLREALQWASALREHVRELKTAAPERLGARKNWASRGELDEARAAFQDLAEAAGLVLAEAGQAIAALLRSWLREFVRWAQDEKKRRGVADFVDQLLWCRDLLRDNLAVRRHFQQRFRAVFVDEFQDTDPLQTEIVFYLTEREPRAREWRDAAVGPGRLFIVGDPKQSIYRFRRADVEMYREAAELLGRQGSKETICQNFRTVPSIIRAVNAFFAPWMGGGAPAAAFQPAYVPLEPYREDWQPAPDAQAPGAYRLAPSEPAGGLAADQVRQLEARLIAWALRGLVGGGRLQVEDRGAWRMSRWSDAVVLMPVFTGIEHLEAALEEAQVPYRVVGGRLFYVRSEIRELTLLASAVWNPADGLALLGALRSAFFGVSDAELAKFVDAGGTLDGSAPVPERARQAAPAVARAIDRLLGWHAALRRLRPAEALRRILDESGYRAFLLMAPNGRQALANVDKLLAQAAAFEEAGAVSFGEFVRWLRRRAPGGAAEAEEEDSPLVGDEDVVRVMTVHKAKGLEFPIVFLANLGERRDDVGSAVVDRAAGRVELHFGPAESGIETSGYRQAVDAERERLRAERVRLYYVAATRARDYLFVSALPEDKGFWRELREAAGAAAVESIPVLAPDPAEAHALREAAAAMGDTGPDWEASPRAVPEAGGPGDLA
ncbi:MAG: UvrD-helicase domain-containing protein, partial [Bacillota bacterium]